MPRGGYVKGREGSKRNYSASKLRASLRNLTNA